MFELHVALIHHPVLNRNKDIVATTITHFDVHDIARVCRSYGVKSYHLIHPSEEQLMYVERLKEHWKIGHGKELNPLRSEAIKIIETSKGLTELKTKYGFTRVIATSARVHPNIPLLDFSSLRSFILEQRGLNQSAEKVLILFGTGSGLSGSVFSECTELLEPIVGFEGSDFRHLSVRSAVAIVLDRIHRT